MLEAFRKNIEISTQKYYSKLSRKLATKKTSPKSYWSIFLITKKLPVYLKLIIINLSQILKKKVDYLTHSLQSNVLILRREAIYLPRYCVEQMNP